MTPASLVLVEQIKILLANTRSASLAHIVVAVMVYYILREYEGGHGVLSLWLACVVVVSSLRLALGSWRYDFSQRKVQKRFLSNYVLLALITGVAWGVLPLLFHDINDYFARNLIFLVIVGLIGSGIATLTVWLPAFYAYMVPQAVGLISVLVLQGDTFNLITAVGFDVYALLMAWTGRNFNQSTHELLQLQVQKQGLIESLNHEIKQREHAQQELVEYQQQLEDQVSLRTSELVAANKDLEKEIGERRKVEEELKFLAHHDPLTLLPNRALLLDRINHAISLSQRSENELAILFIDLDRFKAINDSLGHSVGDRLLQAVAERLEENLRESDTVARNGGDEFVVVIEGLAHHEGLGSTTEKIIAAISQPFTINGHEVHIGTSIGVAIYPDDGQDPATLLKNADTAMYRGKQQGGGGAYYYSESMSQQARERLEMETKLRNALERKEFFMVFQPQVDTWNGKTIGFEALLRWHNPELGVVSPAKFIPLLEETGLIYAVGEWVIRHIVRAIRAGTFGHIQVAINLSPLQCRRMSFAAYIHATLEEYGINPAQLEFEITESLLVENFAQTNRFLSVLHELGCTVALDDFGTGYTSMNYLTQLPIDIIKIDRSFVNKIEEDNNLRGIVTAILTMSRSLHLSNVIEGVESEAQLRAIQALGGYIIQGNYYSTPLPIDAVQGWLKREGHRLGRQELSTPCA